LIVTLPCPAGDPPLCATTAFVSVVQVLTVSVVELSLAGLKLVSPV